MTPSVDSQHTDELVTAMGGARSDASAEPGSPATIDTGALDDVSGGIIDCIPPFPPGRPWPSPLPGPSQPDGQPRPSPLPGPTIPLGPFYPSQPRPDQV
ncbi:MAG TPA: hypothetical protein VFD36_11820 [Kofleriaceae bacterium]|nr:hypothetical protein [Kofleriaceae bacterium]